MIGIWDNEISVDIMSHWANLIDENGWVAREQILGEEARSKVPEEFQVQYPHFANPPTLITGVSRYLDRFSNMLATVNENLDSLTIHPVADHHLVNQIAAKAYMKRVYPKFRRQYQWFLETQWGQIREYSKDDGLKAFRWRGKKGTHILTSGLDDYPRAPDTLSAEMHVDLLCWVAFFGRTLKTIAHHLDLTEDIHLLESDEKEMLKTLDVIHWDQESNTFTDVALLNGEKHHIVHRGYISLFPMLLKLLPADSPKLEAILELIKDPEQLWSPYGLCSLSQSDPYFGQGENYWRGPVF